MRVLITGSKTWTDDHAVWAALDDVANTHGHNGLIVTHGKCPSGADLFAEQWAIWHAHDGVINDPHPADWGHCGPDCPAGHGARPRGRTSCPTAGFRRNGVMVKLGPDEVHSFADPCQKDTCRRPGPHPSHGTDNCVRAAKNAGIPVTAHGITI